MIDVVIHNTSNETHQMQWEYVLSNFKPTKLYCYGPNSMTGSVLKKATTIQGAHDLPDKPLVLMAPKEGVTLKGSTSINFFEFPPEAVYWFGSDSRHLTEEPFLKKQPDHYVYIPTDTEDNMFSWTAYAILAWTIRGRL